MNIHYMQTYSLWCKQLNKTKKPLIRKIAQHIISIDTYIYIHIYTFINVHMHTYTYIHTHTCKHIHTIKHEQEKLF